MAGRRDAGGILALLELIEEHRGALEYDWRTRFHVGLDRLPVEMSYGEAYRQVLNLANDPSTMFSAKLGGLTHPVTREWLALADLIEMTAHAAGDAKYRYPKRPNPGEAADTSRVGDTGGRSPAEVMALLRAAAAGTADEALDPETPEEA